MYTLPELEYAYDALEPHIDARTMEIHHSKHHQGYTNKLNAVLEKNPNLLDQPVETLLQHIDTLDIPEEDKKALQNNGGGYLNHKLFWEIMNPQNTTDTDLVEEITNTFGSIESFKEQFEKNALTQFGSGWSWLVRNTEGILMLYKTANQDSPHLQGHTPILGLDVWEHAYYLNYQNKRGEYVKNWWNIVKII
ncbi:MAG: superoxide dismutase [Candidatus Magasanikbacteria bacterium]|jgi:superoxide dismutase, Fe-Mn family|nr:superoxide dismutase [Candidatus Magasanikbacteria bacterium]MBT4221434.1 superoxide dismutase [Candidatus Magasanikbacteria bacterium]MBT4350718.1 superoxide dismutase [Candidatus Magasanikbacteria bacterium]MBT4541606.1 superoxide dismutase [Candidatus Magasanikbacteria bacterium]MBT6252951.1 superoxide dismutase [Candidatus Magasanikbacteria bacterium]